MKAYPARRFTGDCRSLFASLAALGHLSVGALLPVQGQSAFPPSSGRAHPFPPRRHAYEPHASTRCPFAAPCDPRARTAEPCWALRASGRETPTVGRSGLGPVVRWRPAPPGALVREEVADAWLALDVVLRHVVDLRGVVAALWVG